MVDIYGQSQAFVLEKERKEYVLSKDYSRLPNWNPIHNNLKPDNRDKGK